MKNIETEYKWAISCKADFTKLKAALNAKKAAVKSIRVQISDTYFDSPVGALSAKKAALRLRRTATKTAKTYELTLKSSSQIVNGLAQREETTIPLKAAARPAALAQFKVQAHKLDKDAKNLKRIFSIYDNREIFFISADGFTAELSFDKCLIKSGKHAKLLEAEMEFKEGSRAAFTAFAQYLTNKSGLKPPVKSKVATARALLKNK